MPAYHFFAVCPRTLEPILANELQTLGGQNIKVNAGGVLFQGPLSLAMSVCLNSRYASRVLLRIATRQYYDSHDIYDMAHALPWERFFDVDAKIRVDVTAHRSPLESIDFTTLRIKDGICDRFREGCGKRPSIEKAQPDVRIHAFIDERYCTFYLNLSGEPLFKRGWRIEKGEAPLKENMAAAMVMLTNWRKDRPFIDPVCGSGTLCIEAALIGHNIAPGFNREFVCETWSWFDQDIFEKVRTEADEQADYDVELDILGMDINENMIEIAKQNALEAGLSDSITFKQQAVKDFKTDKEYGVIVANPPYGERLGERDTVRKLYREMGQVMKPLTTWSKYILTSDLAFEEFYGQKATKKRKLYNGALRCDYFQYWGARPPRKEHKEEIK